MSCYNQLKTRNKSLFYESGVDRMFFYVPCGKCEGCREQNVNDWTLRAYYHWRYYTMIGGKIVYITLTYNEEHLPRFSVELSNGDVIDVPCFSSKDVHLYIGRIRKYFERKYCIKDIDYFFTCEFGDIYKRPHVHGLIFFPAGIPEDEIALQCKLMWQGKIKTSMSGKHKGEYMYIDKRMSDEKGRLVYHYSKSILKQCANYGYLPVWSVPCYGHADYETSDKSSAFVRTANAIKYVAKYVNKDISFYDSVKYKDLLSHMKALGNVEGSDLELVSGKLLDLKEKIHECFPRHWQSHNFGKYLVDTLRCLEFDDLVKTINRGVCLPRETYYYRIPNYVIFKLMYKQRHFIVPNDDDLSENMFKDRVIRELTPFGRKLKDSLDNETIKKMSLSLEKACSTIGLQSAFSNPQELFAFFFFREGVQINSYLEAHEYIMHFTAGLDFDEIAIYNLFQKDVVRPKYNCMEIKHRRIYRPTLPDDANIESLSAPLDDEVFFRLELNRLSGDQQLDHLLNLLRDIYKLSLKKTTVRRILEQRERERAFRVQNKNKYVKY